MSALVGQDGFNRLRGALPAMVLRIRNDGRTCNHQEKRGATFYRVVLSRRRDTVRLIALTPWVAV